MTHQARLGLAFLVAGLLVVVLGIMLECGGFALGFDDRIVTGLGILLLGISVSYLVRSQSARCDPKAAGRMVIEAKDERNQFIQARAGSLPAPTLDTLWYYLAASILIPGTVYAISLIYDQKHY